MSNNTVITVLFNQQLNWVLETSNSDPSSQMFAYFPGVISTALGIDSAFSLRGVSFFLLPMNTHLYRSIGGEDPVYAGIHSGDVQKPSGH